MHVDHRLLVLERHVRQALAVGRPDRRDDRLERGERRLGAGAVAVGDLQLEAIAALHHVGDARGKHTLLAGQLLVDEVRDAVRGRAQLIFAERVGDAAERDLFHHVVEAEARLEAAILARLQRADQQRVGKARAPLGVIDVGRLRRLRHDRRQLEAAEEAAALEVRAHDAADARWQRVLAGEGHDRDRDALCAGAGDFDGQLGMRGACPEEESGK